MDKKIGFIGTGNMGTPMLRSLVKSKLIASDNVYIFDTDIAKMEALNSELGVITCLSSTDIVEAADIIILAVKPNIIAKVLEACKSKIGGRKILVSIAVGVPISFYKKILGNDIKIVRTMPNTPAQVSEGMTLAAFDENITLEDKADIKKIFECFGKIEELEEKLMTEVTALTGSSPAYVFMFIEAMADAAVLSGIPRQLAYKLAAQAVLGSAKMVLESGKHPGELKDQVCSPAGTTIEAVASLEKNGFRHAVIDAMNECTRKAKEIGKTYGA